MPEACEPADVLLVVPFLYVSCEEKRRPEISLHSQGITLAFSAEFLQFLRELACSRLLFSTDEREEQASSERASGRKTMGRAKGRACWHLDNHHSPPTTPPTSRKTVFRVKMTRV